MAILIAGENKRKNISGIRANACAHTYSMWLGGSRLGTRTSEPEIPAIRGVSSIRLWRCVARAVAETPKLCFILLLAKSRLAKIRDTF